MAGEYLAGFLYPWQALGGISGFIESLGKTLGADYKEIAPRVWVHKSARVADTAYIGAPAIIGADSEVKLRCRQLVRA